MVHEILLVEMEVFFLHRCSSASFTIDINSSLALILVKAKIYNIYTEMLGNGLRYIDPSKYFGAKMETYDIYSSLAHT